MRRFCGEAFGVVGLRIGVVEVVVWSLAELFQILEGLGRHVHCSLGSSILV